MVISPVPEWGVYQGKKRCLVSKPVGAVWWSEAASGAQVELQCVNVSCWAEYTEWQTRFLHQSIFLPWCPYYEISPRLSRKERFREQDTSSQMDWTPHSPALNPSEGCAGGDVTQWPDSLINLVRLPWWLCAVVYLKGGPMSLKISVKTHSLSYFKHMWEFTVCSSYSVLCVIWSFW